jgi:hypothetical protein
MLGSLEEDSGVSRRCRFCAVPYAFSSRLAALSLASTIARCHSW